MFDGKEKAPGLWGRMLGCKMGKERERGGLEDVWHKEGGGGEWL